MTPSPWPLAPVGSDPTSSTSTVRIPAPSRFWPGLAAGFAGLWLLTLWLWRRAARARPDPSTPESATTANEGRFLEQLRRACEAGDRAAARRSLRGWLRVRGAADKASLLDFAAATDDAELRSAIYALDAAGFRPSGAGDWDGGSFWRQFKAWRAQQAKAAEAQGALTDLYAPRGRGGAG